MPEVLNNKVLPSPRVIQRAKKSLAWVWLIPILALLVGLSIVWRGIANQGPKIAISFQSATGIETGKTQIRYRDVVIGLVKDVRLNGMQDGVVVDAELTKDGEMFAREGTRFWVVRPRIGIGGVSGLTTLLSGSYIETDFDTKSDRRVSEKVFTGLDQPPPIAASRPGSQFVLRSPNLGSLGPGAPIYYRRIQVGLVTEFKLDKSGKFVDLSIFVDAPYDKFVDSSTRFWNESGIDLTVGAGGVHLQTESLLSLIAGGVSFASFGKTSPLKTPSEPFKLFDSQRSAELVPQGVAFPIRMSFLQSARGLVVGAPVAFHGVDIGIVNIVALDFDEKTKKFFTNVEATIYPERLGTIYLELDLGTLTNEELSNRLKILISRGLRAQLRSSNILTGQLYVTLGDFPEAAQTQQADFVANSIHLTIPTVSTDDMDSMQSKLTSIITKIDKIPFEKIAEDLNGMLNEIKRLSSNVDKNVTPKLSSTLVEIEKTVKNLNGLIAPGSPITTSTESMLADLKRSLNSLRVLTDGLQANPDEIIRGRSTQPYSREKLGAPAK